MEWLKKTMRENTVLCEVVIFMGIVPFIVVQFLTKSGMLMSVDMLFPSAEFWLLFIITRMVFSIIVIGAYLVIAQWMVDNDFLESHFEENPPDVDVAMMLVDLSILSLPIFLVVIAISEALIRLYSQTFSFYL